MTDINANQAEARILIKQDGIERALTEDQVILMLEEFIYKSGEEAMPHFRRLCDANPGAMKLRWKYYSTLMQMFMFEELLDSTNDRLAKDPDCHLSVSWRIQALQNMGRNDEVIETLEGVASKHPTDFTSINALGLENLHAGDNEKALRCFNRAIEIQPRYAEPYWYKSELADDYENELSNVEEFIASGNCPGEHQHYLHFAAYRYCDKLERLDEAFQHLQLGNQFRRRQLDFNVEHEVQVDTTAGDIFDQTFFEKTVCQQTSDVKPIFIMGMPRSGTTLVEQIIASHSTVSGGDEYTALANAIFKVQMASQYQGPVDQWLRSLQHDDWQNIGEAYYQNTRFIRGENTVFTDKNQFNYRSIGIIKASIPNAKIVVVERNPMDVLFGCYRQLFGGQGVKFSYQLDELVTAYSSHQKLMHHWQTVSGDFLLRIHYEDIVREPKQSIERLLNFCELPIEQDCFEFHKSKRNVKTLSASQVRQPIFSEGISRWKRYEEQLQPLVRLAENAGLDIA